MDVAQEAVIKFYFRDNPKLGDGNFYIIFCFTFHAVNFRDNPKLGDGNIGKQSKYRLQKATILEITPN